MSRGIGGGPKVCEHVAAADDPLVAAILDHTRDCRDRLQRAVDVMAAALERIRGEVVDCPADTARRALEMTEGFRR